MARRSTAPSLWLPGFDPDEPAVQVLPEPARVQACANLAALVAAPPPPESTPNEAAHQAEAIEPATVVARASWRTTSQIVEATARTLWPQLVDDGALYPLGAVAKFEALGVLQFEDLKHDGAIDWATLEAPLMAKGEVIAA